MNRLLLLSLTLALLSSCSNETNTSTSSNTGSSTVTQEEKPVEQEETPAEENETTEEETPVEGETAEEQGDDLGAEFVLPVGDNLISNRYAEAICLSRSEDENIYNPVIIEDDDEFGAIVFPLFSFDPSMAEAYAISASAMMVQAYGVAAILPVEGQEEAVMAGLQQFIDTQIQNFTGYLPDQLEIAQSARIETLEDGTLFMVMSPEPDRVFDEFVANLQELSTMPR